MKKRREKHKDGKQNELRNNSRKNNIELTRVNGRIEYWKVKQKIIELDKDDKKYNEFLKKPWMNTGNKQKIKNKQKELSNFLDKIIAK